MKSSLNYFSPYKLVPYSWGKIPKLILSLSSSNKLVIPQFNNSNCRLILGSHIMVRQLKLSHTFRSIKPNCNPNPNPKIEIEPRKSIEDLSTSSQPKSDWCVYLIASTNSPFKTYVGVTTDFTRRLKQHNGELKGGAKASRAGRPWVCACVVQGFSGRSQACEFESNWKNISKKMPRKRNIEGVKEENNKRLRLLLHHRYAAMEKLKDSFSFSHLHVDWQLSPL